MIRLAARLAVALWTDGASAWHVRRLNHHRARLRALHGRADAMLDTVNYSKGPR